MFFFLWKIDIWGTYLENIGKSNHDIGKQKNCNCQIFA